MAVLATAFLWIWFVCLRCCLAAGIILATALYVHGSKLLHAACVFALQHKLHVQVTLEAVAVRLSLRGENIVELRGLTVANADGNWSVPHAFRLRHLRLCCRGLLGLLSLIKLVRVGEHELVLGFRVKEIETLDIEDCELFLEDAVADASGAASVLLRGTLRKEPLSSRLGSLKRRDFVLEPDRLLWFEPAKGRSAQNASPRGSLRLHASSVVEPAPDGGLSFTLRSGKEELTLLASSAEQRDEWVGALASAIRARRQTDGVQLAGSNAPWLEELAAEGGAKELRRVRAAQRRRREWQRRWQEGAEGASAGKGAGVVSASRPAGDEESVEASAEEDALSAEGTEAGGAEAEGAEGVSTAVEDEESSAAAEAPSPRDMLREVRSALFANRELPGADFLSKLRELHRGHAQQLVSRAEHSASASSEDRFKQAVQWHIGRLSVSSLAVNINGRALCLAEDGWALRGFVGTEAELKRHILFVEPRACAGELLRGRAVQASAAALPAPPRPALRAVDATLTRDPVARAGRPGREAALRFWHLARGEAGQAGGASDGGRVEREGRDSAQHGPSEREPGRCERDGSRQ